MYIYNIGYYSCEESEYKQFIHDKEFSEEELENIVEECLFVALLVELKFRNKDDPEFNWGGEEFNEPSLSDLFSSTYNHQTFVEEMTNKGFVPIRFTREVSLFGWASATNPESWDGHTNGKTKEMIGKLKKRLDAHCMHK